MSRRERDARVRLDGISGEQAGIARASLTDFLVAQAEDLRLLHTVEDPEGAIREVAALARMVAALRDGQLAVPDPAAREVMARIAGEVEEMDEELVERYEEAVAERRALCAFLAFLGEAGGEAR